MEPLEPLEALETLEALEPLKALEALQAGRGGAAGDGLMDPRLLDKPGKFDGSQSAWKDWSESIQAFCDVADVMLGEAMRRYA